MQEDQWYPFLRFPLDSNLSNVHLALDQQGVVHRFTEEKDQQILWLYRKQDEALTIKCVQGEIDLGEQKNRRFGPLAVSISKDSIVTLSLIGISVTVFLLMNFVSPYGVIASLKFESLSALRMSSEYWRILTPVFMHFGIAHLVFNCCWIYLLGIRIEADLKLLYLPFVLLVSVLSNYAQFAIGGSELFGGLSGLVYGMLGYCLVAQRLFHSRTIYFPTGLYVFMLVWLGLGFFGAFDLLVGGKLANWAHAGGLIAGALFSFGRHLFEESTRNER